MIQLVPPSSSSETTQPEQLPLGSITPRLWTRPLRKLTPETSYGYRVIWYAANVLREPLDPWQQWLVIHLGELLPDGRPRFRRVLVLVARQNGKTHVCRVLALYWLFVECIGMVLGTSTKLDYAKEPWSAAVKTAQRIPSHRRRIPRRGGVVLGKGEQTLMTTDGCRYKIGTADSSGGRSLPVERLIGDELREQRTWEAYDAAYNAMNAQPHGQAVWITNEGDARSVVLNTLRDDALEFIRTGVGDERLGLFWWGAADGTHPMDVNGWAAANPQLGRRMDYDTIHGQAVNVSKPGVDPQKLAGFLTEVLCMAVPSLRPAVDPVAWARGNVPAPIAGDVRSAVALCVDVAPDMLHATVCAGARLPDGRVRVEAVAAYSGVKCLDELAAALPALVAKIRPRAVGWFPNGPAAALDADLRDRTKTGRARVAWPPRGVTVQALGSDAYAVCMGFAVQVAADRVLHSGQQLLDEHMQRAQQQFTGDRWVFGRPGDEHVDAAYAAAGAVHLARTLPAPRVLAGPEVV